MSKTTDSNICPWGYYTVLLDSDECKVKEIVVNSGHRLSYQIHSKREEFWTIVKGIATVTLNGEVKDYKEGEIVRIPSKMPHRAQNSQPTVLKFIEIQRGDYFGEDDIIRLEDDYNRVL